MHLLISKPHQFQQPSILDSKAVDGHTQTEETALLNSCEHQTQEPVVESKTSGKLRRICACPPQGIIARIVTNAMVLVWSVAWSITGQECLPGGNLFGILFLFFSAVIGGKFMGIIKLPGLPPFPPLLGMLLVGFLLRNVPLISNIVRIKVKWAVALKNIALSVILARAGLGLDPKVDYELCLDARMRHSHTHPSRVLFWCGCEAEIGSFCI
uniref:Cation/H+ exchanger domain-containing protein n=1 Tax=Podarcis muralis TaxID=64176 RepID=A0A670IU10_PODMU